MEPDFNIRQSSWTDITEYKDLFKIELVNSNKSAYILNLEEPLIYDGIIFGFYPNRYKRALAAFDVNTFKLIWFRSIDTISPSVLGFVSHIETYKDKIILYEPNTTILYILDIYTGETINLFDISFKTKGLKVSQSGYISITSDVGLLHIYQIQEAVIHKIFTYTFEDKDESFNRFEGDFIVLKNEKGRERVIGATSEKEVVRGYFTFYCRGNFVYLYYKRDISVDGPSLHKYSINKHKDVLINLLDSKVFKIDEGQTIVDITASEYAIFKEPGKIFILNSKNSRILTIKFTDTELELQTHMDVNNDKLWVGALKRKLPSEATLIKISDNPSISSYEGIIYCNNNKRIDLINPESGTPTLFAEFIDI